MCGFFKKFTGDSSRGKPCKDCGHGETSHHLKIVDPEQAQTQAYNNKIIRVNCRECDCRQFK